MSSNAKQTKFRRALRLKNAGRAAKNDRTNHGTTPAFPIHTPEADANAPHQAKQSSED